MKKFESGIDLRNQRLINLADGSAPTDGVTLQQLQAAIRGLDWKQSALAATTTAITLSGTQTIDGVAAPVGARILVKDQADPKLNGLYSVSSGAWTRTSDADADVEVTSGLAVTVEQGTVNADKVFVLVTDGSLVIGTSSLLFSPLGGSGVTYMAGNGVTISGSQIAAVVKAGGGLIVDSTGIYVDTSIVARKGGQSIGDGAATTLLVTHNLGTKGVTFSIRNTTTDEFVEADVYASSVNTVSVTFGAAPAAAAYAVTVIG